MRHGNLHVERDCEGGRGGGRGEQEREDGGETHGERRSLTAVFGGVGGESESESRDNDKSRAVARPRQQPQVTHHPLSKKTHQPVPVL